MELIRVKSFLPNVKKINKVNLLSPLIDNTYFTMYQNRSLVDTHFYCNDGRSKDTPIKVIQTLCLYQTYIN